MRAAQTQPQPGAQVQEGVQQRHGVRPAGDGDDERRRAGKRVAESGFHFAMDPVYGGVSHVQTPEVLGAFMSQQGAAIETIGRGTQVGERRGVERLIVRPSAPLPMPSRLAP